MKKRLFIVGLFVFSGILFAEFPEKARPYVHVYDYANKLTEEQKAWFDQNTLSYLQTGKAQIVIVLITNNQFDRYGTIEDAAVDIFKTWGIGEKGKDNGILIILSPGRRKVRIEVGYGLEKWLTDGTCGYILDKNIEHYKQGRWFVALRGTVVDVQIAINRGYQKDGETPIFKQHPQKGTFNWRIFLWATGIGVIIFFLHCFFGGSSYSSVYSSRSSDSRRHSSDSRDGFSPPHHSSSSSRSSSSGGGSSGGGGASRGF